MGVKLSKIIWVSVIIIGVVLFLVFMTTAPLVPSFVTNPIYRENKIKYDSSTGIVINTVTPQDAFLQKKYVDSLPQDIPKDIPRGTTQDISHDIPQDIPQTETQGIPGTLNEK